MWQSLKSPSEIKWRYLEESQEGYILEFVLMEAFVDDKKNLVKENKTSM